MMKKFLLALFLLLSFKNFAQIGAGHIVVIGLSGDPIDEFSWVPLVNLSAGEVIYFSDAGYSNNSSVWMGLSNSSEFLLKFTVPAGGIASGTVQTVRSSSEGSNYTYVTTTRFGGDASAFDLQTAGDQIIIFQSTDTEDSNFGNSNFNPIFQATSSTANYTTYSGSNNAAATNLSPGLTDGTNAVAAASGNGALDEFDNVRYTGTLSGTVSAILAAVATASNWEGINTTVAANWTANGAGSFTILPVELTSFKAEIVNSTIDLDWQTAMEENNEGFHIQRSIDGQKWENIGFVMGMGTTQEEQNYTYIDKEPLPNINYYRLKQIDFDGAFEYSSIVSVNYDVDLKANSLNIFPNPVSNQITVQGVPSNIRLYNLLGQTLKTIRMDNEILKIDLATLPKGQYFLEISADDGTQIVKKFIKN